MKVTVEAIIELPDETELIKEHPSTGVPALVVEGSAFEPTCDWMKYEGGEHDQWVSAGEEFEKVAALRDEVTTIEWISESEARARFTHWHPGDKDEKGDF